MKQRIRRFTEQAVPLLLIAAVIVLAGWWFLRGNNETHEGNLITSLEELQNLNENSYQNYLISHKDAPHPDMAIRVEGESYSKADGTVEVMDNFQGMTGKSVKMDETGSLTWDFVVPEEGLYNMKLRYYTIEGKSSAIERELLIDGKVPFQGADALLFDRVWKNATNQFKKDKRGNELRPTQVEVPTWQEELFKDPQGTTAEPYQFFFTKGHHSITLTSLREPAVIDYVELFQDKEPIQYADLKKQYDQSGYKPANDFFFKVQGEDADFKSSPTLYPIMDRTSPATEPTDVSKIRLNTIGGYNWRMPGQWIEWQVDVPQDGLYKIGLKVRQNILRGIYSNRKLYIDGQVPFQEMESVPFYYSGKWQMIVPGTDDNNPYMFYLTKGKHTLCLENNLGDIALLLNTVESSVQEINKMYRKILIITSANPDQFRDYQLAKRIPEMTKVFQDQSDILYSVADKLKSITGEKSDKTAPLYTLARQLSEFAKEPESVPVRLKNFKTNIGSLGTWILTTREMPLEVDYVIVASPDHKMPKADASNLAKMGREIGSFAYSFIEDYNSIGDVDNKGKKITVWIGAGRDQAQVIKQMLNDTFTPNNGIQVDLKLVDMSVLLSATLAGQGPDVAMMIGNGDPVNYAMRKASYDVSKFPDFNEVAKRFQDSAMVPYRFNGGTYALPEQQIFDVLFYRKDVLQELGLQIPDTWDDVYKMIPELQKNNMDFGIPLQDPNTMQWVIAINDIYATLLYQNNGSFYRDSDSASSLDSEVAMKAFQQWTDLYTAYKFPLQYDFINRFRLGEVPIGIAPYTTYNTLSVSAPEIRGLWDFTVVPGIKQADGEIHRDVPSNGTAVMMLNTAKDKNSSWEFMKWWTNKDTQVRYGREMESLMGESARYPTANVEALEELPWPIQDYKHLMDQWKWVKGIPEVPGGYFTGRHLDNAFRKVVNSGENPRDALYDGVLVINNEITAKRNEFGLSDKPEVKSDGGH